VVTAGQAGFQTPIPFAAEALDVRVAELVRLQRSAQRINGTLNLDEIIERVVSEVSSTLGCAEINLYLHHPAERELVLAGVRGCTVHKKGHRLKVGTEGMVGFVAESRQMHYAPDVAQDPYYMACRPDTSSEVAIPLQIEGELVGVFTASHCEVDAFSPAHLRLLQGLCSHVAVAVQNSRRFHDEHKLRRQLTREADEARAIQQALMPRSSPCIPGFRVTGLSVPAGAVGGDWYDFIPLPDGRWSLVLADVSGKGTAAALLMSSTRGMVRSLAHSSSGPAEVLTRLNKLLLEDLPDGRFVTMVYAELDPASRTLRIANAGHLPPLLVEPSGHRWIATEHGLPLGIAAGKFSETPIVLSDDSLVTLYSDGITEAALESGEEYGAERLLEQMKAREASLEALLADVKNFVNSCGLRDDATAILIGTKGQGSTSN
jgi:sigma-B regulation protein RsbU (phosphoserine phosphatase)